MKILAVTGASGGHIYPALGFLDTLKEKYKDTETLLVLPKTRISANIENSGNKISYISFFSFKTFLDFRNITAILGFIKCSFESLFIILKFRPDAVVGFGSLLSVPMVSLAWLFRVKTLIHEQNVVAGRANRLLSNFTDRIAVSFAQTRDYFSCSRDRIKITGNPLRKGLEKCGRIQGRDLLGLDKDKFTVLVMGGSQGSHSINLGFLKAISAVSDRNNLQIIHLTGEKDADFLRKAYAQLNINVKLFIFLKYMQYAYCAADLALCRAGATTIAEIAFFKVPAVLVPYPYANKHQLANAEVLAKAGCALLIEDSHLENGRLKQALEELIRNPDRLSSMRECYDNIVRGYSNDSLADEVMSLNDGYAN